jgi:hypothetical protein
VLVPLAAWQSTGAVAARPVPGAVALFRSLRCRSANCCSSAVIFSLTYARAAPDRARLRWVMVRRERGQAASCCLPRAVPGALMGGDSARRRMT